MIDYSNLGALHFQLLVAVMPTKPVCINDKYYYHVMQNDPDADQNIVLDKVPFSFITSLSYVDMGEENENLRIYYVCHSFELLDKLNKSPLKIIDRTFTIDQKLDLLAFFNIFKELFDIKEYNVLMIDKEVSYQETERIFYEWSGEIINGFKL